MRRIPLLFLLFAITVSCKKENFSVTRIEGKQLEVNSAIPPDDSISQFIAPYKEHIDKEMNAILSYSPVNLVKTDGELNTALGNLMADAVMELGNPIFEKRTGHSVDLVLLNHGGIRSSIQKGDVTTRTAFQLMPFENEVVVAEMKGKVVRKLVLYLIDSGTAHPVSGVELVLNPDNSIKKLLIQGEPLNEDQSYFVATNDYLFQGGDNMVFFQEADEVVSLNYKIRNLLIDYFKKQDTLAPVRDGRFIRLK